MHLFYNMKLPPLGSLLARGGILMAMAVAMVWNFQTWAGRGEWQAAWLSLAAECVAAGGLVMVLHHWPVRKLMAIGGLVVTALAGGWSALTMTERLSEDAHQRALGAAEHTTAYEQAEQDLITARALYGAALAEQVPSQLGPLTTEQRSLDLERRREALKAERDGVQARLDHLTPEAPAFDLQAVARGWGAMLAVILGLSVFGVHGRQEAPVKQPNDNEPEHIPLTASELGRLGAARKRELREEAEAKRLARNAYMRDYRRRGQDQEPDWSKHLFGQLPN